MPRLLARGGKTGSTRLIGPGGVIVWERRSPGPHPAGLPGPGPASIPWPVAGPESWPGVALAVEAASEDIPGGGPIDCLAVRLSRPGIFFLITGRSLTGGVEGRGRTRGGSSGPSATGMTGAVGLWRKSPAEPAGIRSGLRSPGRTTRRTRQTDPIAGTFETDGIGPEAVKHSNRACRPILAAMGQDQRDGAEPMGFMSVSEKTTRAEAGPGGRSG